jgi:hypothetical protein
MGTDDNGYELAACHQLGKSRKTPPRHPSGRSASCHGRLKARQWRSLAPESEECRIKEVLMKIPVQVKPAAWGAVGGAVAAMIIGFAWGGWVTGGTSDKNAGVAAQTAVVQAFVPLCVAKAEQQPEELILLKKESSYSRKDFVVKAGWVSNVAEKYRRNVAESCASAIVEAMDAVAAKKP